MAVLEKIRKRSVLLIVIIGVSLLMFILSSLVGKGNVTLFGDNNSIGEVNGEVIDRVEFADMVASSTSNNPNVSIMNAVNSVWNQKVNQIILDQQFEKLGIDVSGDRIMNLIKKNPQLTSSPLFQNENGLFDPQKFIDYVADMKATNPQMYESWKMQEQYIIDGAKRDIYYALIQAGLGVTEKEGEAGYAEEANTVDFTYVQVPYTVIPDSSITVSDTEIKEYINKHKDQFEKEATRDFKYIIFDETPTAADIDNTKNAVASLLNDKVEWVDSEQKEDTVYGFKNTKDVRGFVAENSDVKYDSTYVLKSALPVAFADTLYNLNIGEVYGPYKDGDFFKVSKMINKKAGGSAKVSHILIAYDGAERAAPKESRTKEQAEALAKEVMAKVKAKGSDFEALAKEYSEDPGVASNNGVYDNITPTSSYAQEFKDFALEHETGTIDVVETSFGYHVMKVLEKQETVNLATVARKVTASEGTISALYNQSNQFIYKVKEEGKDFDEAAKAGDLKVKIANVEELGGGLPGLDNQRSIIKWAFESDTEIGDVKKFNIPNGYAVVQVTGKTDKGLQSPEKASAQVTPILRKEKKAAQIMEKAKGKSIDDFAALYNVGKKDAVEVTLSAPTISGAGSEPKVVGTAFGLKEGAKSGLIEGDKGVFMIEVKKKVEAPKLENYTAYRNAKREANIQKYSQSVMDALKKSADIEDNRAKFY